MRRFDTPRKLGFLSDVHAKGKLFKDALNAAFLDHGVDQVVITGDLINKGPDNIEVLRETMKLVVAKKAIFIAGNHELAKMAGKSEKLSRRRKAWQEVGAVHSGGVDIFQDIEDESAELTDIWKFLMGAPLFYRDEQRFAVHAGLINGRIDQTVRHLEIYRRNMKRGYFREVPPIDSFTLARQETGALDEPDMLVVTGHHSHTGPVLTSDNRRARLAAKGNEFNLLVHQVGKVPVLQKIR